MGIRSQTGPIQDGLRDKRLTIDYFQYSFFNIKQSSGLPGGVIGNTWAFDAHVPGSSPGRVSLNRQALLVKRKASYTYPDTRYYGRKSGDNTGRGD